MAGRSVTGASPSGGTILFHPQEGFGQREFEVPAGEVIVDGPGRPLSYGHGLDDRGHAGDQVPPGEDGRDPGLQGFGIHHQGLPGGNREAGDGEPKEERSG